MVYNDGTTRHKQVVVAFMYQRGDTYVFDTTPKVGALEILVKDIVMMIQTEMPPQPWPMAVGTGRRR